MTSETLHLVSQTASSDSLRPSPVTAWVRRHQDGLWRWLRFLGCPADLAEDVMQDALLAALHAGIDRDRTDAVASGWLRSTARNLCRSALRRSHRRPECELLPEVEAEAAFKSHAGDDGGSDYVHALRTCLGKLEPRHRRAVQLRYGDDAPRAAIAAELDLGEEGVKTLLRRLRAGLRACVERALEERQ